MKSFGLMPGTRRTRVQWATQERKVKKWNKTSIVWHMWGYDGGYGRDKAITAIPVSNVLEGVEVVGSFHVCTLIKVESRITRNVKCTIFFNNVVGHPPSIDDSLEIKRWLESMRYVAPKFDIAVGEFENSRVEVEIPL